MIEKMCEQCKQPFASYPSGNRRFCSLACRSAFRFNKEPTAAQERISFTCRECTGAFTMMRSYLDAYRKKHSHDPLYCSRTCSATGRRKMTEQKRAFVCETCGTEVNRSRKPGGRLYDQQKYCSPECRHEMIRRRALTRFERGDHGRHIKRNGYVWISIPQLARSGPARRSVMEHRYVMSQHLGRELFAEETVHHVNGDRQDNRLENLELFSSRHGPGQRVIDKVRFAIEMLRLYPDFARAEGVELRDMGDSAHEPSGTLSLPA